MTLPSPCFVENVTKPAVELKSRVNIETTNPIRFVAFCKYCREGFASDNLLFQHRKEHERCPYEDCKFNASGKVVADHISRVHMKSNAMVKIQDLTTPEQIEKWREERRKRYPTTSNVLLRQQAQEERFSRGEKLQDRQQRFGDNRQRNQMRSSEGGQGRKQYDNNRDNRGNNRDRKPRYNKSHDKSDQEVKTESCETTTEVKEEGISEAPAINDVIVKTPEPKIHAFKVVTALPTPQNDDSSDDETRATPKFTGTLQMKDYHQVETIVKEQSALSVLGMYDSDSEIDDETPVEETVVQPNSTEANISINNSVDTEDNNKAIDEEEASKGEEMQQPDLDDDAPAEVPIQHEADAVSQEPIASANHHRNPRKRRHGDHQLTRRTDETKSRSALDYSKLRRKASANLFLEKLLQDDIRHERNILLQCVNYVVKSNFFGVGQSTTIAETAVAENQAENNLEVKVATHENDQIDCE